MNNKSQIVDRKLILTAVIFFILGGFIVSLFNTLQSQKLSSSEQPNQQIKATPPPIPCEMDNGTVGASVQTESEIAKRVFNNQAALKLIKDKCMWVFGAIKGDLQNSGKENIVFWGSDAGCGSCHGQEVFVLSEDKVVFDQLVRDPIVEIIKHDGENLLSIVEPLRKEDETLGDPSWGVKTLYRWSKSPPGFYPFDSRPYEYKKNE